MCWGARLTTISEQPGLKGRLWNWEELAAWAWVGSMSASAESMRSVAPPQVYPWWLRGCHVIWACHGGSQHVGRSMQKGCMFCGMWFQAPQGASLWKNVLETGSWWFQGLTSKKQTQAVVKVAGRKGSKFSLFFTPGHGNSSGPTLLFLPPQGSLTVVCPLVAFTMVMLGA